MLGRPADASCASRLERLCFRVVEHLVLPQERGALPDSSCTARVPDMDATEYSSSSAVVCQLVLWQLY